MKQISHMRHIKLQTAMIFYTKAAPEHERFLKGKFIFKKIYKISNVHNVWIYWSIVRLFTRSAGDFMCELHGGLTGPLGSSERLAALAGTRTKCAMKNRSV